MKVKITKSTIHEGRLHEAGKVMEVGNGKEQIPRKHAEVLLDLEHAEEHEEPEPAKPQTQTGGTGQSGAGAGE